MNKKNRTRLIIGLIILAVAGLIGWKIYDNSLPGQYDGFAQCLKDKGAVFYGAFWCPHCQDQKKDFGKSAKYLPYVECSTPDGRGQNQACTDKNVEGYPEWIFADGSRESGRLSLDRLAEKTACQLP